MLQRVHFVVQDGVDTEVIFLRLALGTGDVEHVTGAVRAVDPAFDRRRPRERVRCAGAADFRERARKAVLDLGLAFALAEDASRPSTPPCST